MSRARSSAFLWSAVAATLLIAGPASAGSATTTTLSASPTPSTIGQTLSLTAAVGATGGSFTTTGGVRKLAGGQYSTCALLDGGGLKCWGNNQFGEFGDGSTTPSLVPVRTMDGAAYLTGAVRVVAGNGHMCTLMADTTVRCWGSGGFGQLGNGDNLNISMPVAVSDADDMGVATGEALASVTTLAAGVSHTCAVLSPKGNVKCWGGNASYQLGNGTNAASSLPVSVKNASVDNPALAGDPIEGVTDVVVGAAHTCVLMNGGVKCWGSNLNGQLGYGGSGMGTDQHFPVSVLADASQMAPPLANVTMLASGSFHVCALMSDTTVKCWGRNNSGQLGNGVVMAESSTPVTVSDLTGATAIAAGNNRTCALVTGGKIKCWGTGAGGQLGVGSPVSSTVPVTVKADASAGAADLEGATAILGGVASQQNCALVGNGVLRCWGLNNLGGVGDGTTVNRLTPVPVHDPLAGAVTFLDGIKILDTVPVSDGKAILQTTALSGGFHTFLAKFVSDSGFAPSASPAITLIVNGGAGNDVLTGGPGDDTMTGGAGNDTITGNAGDDIIEGGPGKDTLDGGAGIDTLSFAASPKGVKADLSKSVIDGDKVSNFENLLGSAFDDVLIGNGKANRLDGGTGRDVLIGRKGKDVLIGGADADRFKYFSSAESSRRKPDVIMDFSVKGGDVIDLSRFDGDKKMKGRQRFTSWRGKKPFTGKTGQLRFVRGALLGDTDGDGKADFKVVLKGVKRLPAKAVKRK